MEHCVVSRSRESPHGPGKLPSGRRRGNRAPLATYRLPRTQSRRGHLALAQGNYPLQFPAEKLLRYSQNRNRRGPRTHSSTTAYQGGRPVTKLLATYLVARCGFKTVVPERHKSPDVRRAPHNRTCRLRALHRRYRPLKPSCCKYQYSRSSDSVTAATAGIPGGRFAEFV